MLNDDDDYDDYASSGLYKNDYPIESDKQNGFNKSSDFRKVSVRKPISNGLAIGARVLMHWALEHNREVPIICY